MSNQIPLGPKDMVCPLHRKYMNKVCHMCPLWVKITGKNPQSTEIIDKWNCSLAWLPVLQIETTQMTRGTGVAIESFRNEVVARSGLPANSKVARLPSGDEFETKYVKPVNGPKLIENR